MTQPKPSLDSGKHLSMSFGSTPIQESPGLSVFLCRGFQSCKPSDTAMAPATATRAPLAPPAQPGGTEPERSGSSSMVVATLLPPLASLLFFLPERLAESLPFFFGNSMSLLPMFCCWFGFCLFWGGFFEHFLCHYPFPCCSQLLCCSALSNQSLF